MSQELGVDRHIADGPGRADIGNIKINFGTKIANRQIATRGNDRDMHMR